MVGFHLSVVAISTQAIVDKLMKRQIQEELLNTVYNLILNPDTKEEERRLLLDFKNQVGTHIDMEQAISNLSENIRQLAVHNITTHSSLSLEVAKLYKKISSDSEKERNIARGIASFGIFR